MSIDTGGAKRPLPKVIPERIKEAREARGLTIDAFAEALRVSRQAVAQYETGQIAPGGEVMSRIVAVTDQPLPFFTSPPARLGELGAPFWRSLKRMELHHRRRVARRLQWASDICSLVERFVDLPVMNLPRVDFDPYSSDDDDIERAAETLREHWGMGLGPVRNLAVTMEENGIVVVRESVSCEDMDAVSCWIGGRAFVLLADEVSSGPRDLFNLAHELGHLILHASVEVDSRNLDRIEKQANRFAGSFLLPRESFSREVLGTSIGYFKVLKERWGVAIAAMAYRCKDLEILTDNQFSYIFKQMSIQKIRKREPLDDVFPVNKPSMLPEAIRMIVEHGVYTRDQIESALALNMRDVESLCGVESGYLDTRVVHVQFRRPSHHEQSA